jgi:SAM-dependent methyltransferase
VTPAILSRSRGPFASPLFPFAFSLLPLFPFAFSLSPPQNAPVQSDDFREFQFPLNVFMLILIAEEGEARYLHYGIFESADESIANAQQRSTELMLQRLPAPPARILDVGIGLGTTLSTLQRLGYEVTGITPDLQQVEAAKKRWGAELPAIVTRFEDLDDSQPFDVVLFQESAQYIAPATIFSRCAKLAPRVVVVDEFATRPFAQAGSLHQFSEFLREAETAGFQLTGDLDVSSKASPTTAYFMKRLPAYRQRLIDELGITDADVDHLLTSGRGYLDAYAAGDYTYRLLEFERKVTSGV